MLIALLMVVNAATSLLAVTQFCGVRLAISAFRSAYSLTLAAAVALGEIANATVLHVRKKKTIASATAFSTHHQVQSHTELVLPFLNIHDARL